MKAVQAVAMVLVMAVTVMGLCSAQGKMTDKPTGFRGDFLWQLGDVEKKVVDLAEAMPEAKYGWRPEEGVRSVSEVFVHIAGANYLFASFAGVKTPEGIDEKMEKTITEKAKVIEAVKKSFAFMRDAVMNTTDADLAKPAKMFGMETTVQNVYFVCANHMHEHLGQSIAYARMNGVVPPWTAAEMAKQKEQMQK